MKWWGQDEMVKKQRISYLPHALALGVVVVSSTALPAASVGVYDFVKSKLLAPINKATVADAQGTVKLKPKTESGWQPVQIGLTMGGGDLDDRNVNSAQIRFRVQNSGITPGTEPTDYNTPSPISE